MLVKQELSELEKKVMVEKGVLHPVLQAQILNSLIEKPKYDKGIFYVMGLKYYVLKFKTNYEV